MPLNMPAHKSPDVRLGVIYGQALNNTISIDNLLTLNIKYNNLCNILKILL